MTGLTRKLTLTLLAAFSSVCISFGLISTVPKAAFAAEDDSGAPAGTALESADLLFDEADENQQVLLGLTDAGKEKLNKAASTARYSLVVPDSVTEIADNAFSGYNKITSITIPEGVTAIGDLAFARLVNLTEINFYATACGDFSSDITKNPFLRAGYSIKTTVNLGKSDTALTKIPAYMFYGNSGNPNKISTVNFVSVNLADGAFGTHAFAGCTSLTEVNFGESTVTTIGDYAFYQCYALTGITIPAEVKTIGIYALSQCSALADVDTSSASALTTLGERAFYQCSALTTIEIPASVTAINANAFSNSGLTQLTIPSGVASIGRNAFSNCANLAEIKYFAKNATGSDRSPFENSGKKITVEIGSSSNQINRISPYLFYKTNVTSVKLTNVNTGANNFGQTVFAGCELLTSVEFYNCNIPTMGASTFSGCSAIRKIELPSQLTSISEATFQECGSLYDVVIPSGVTSIGEKAFYSCVSLYTINIPSGVTSIGAEAFYNCTKLIEVEDLSTALTINKGQVKAGGNSVNDYTGAYAKNVYTATEGESKIAEGNGYVFYKGDELLLIGYKGTETALNLSTDLQGTEFANSEYVIYDGAFRSNRLITGVVVSDKATAINKSAFKDCTALTSVTLPEGLVYIRGSLFEGCTALTSITIPSTVTTIADSAFKDCTRLKTVNFNTKVSGNTDNDQSKYSLKTIDTSAFENCTGLVSFTIPNTVTSLGGYAFRGCKNLSAVYMPDALENYNVVGLFDNCDHENLIIIVPAENYQNYNDNFESYDYGTITYIVNVYLIYGEYGEPGSANTQTVERLYGYEYDFERQTNGTWANTEKMPVQEGYKTSKWYADSSYEDVMEANELTRELNKINVNDPTVKLYAKYVEKPSLEMDITTKEYSESAVVGYDRIFKNYTANGNYGIEIKEYRLVGGALAAVPENVKAAGTYTLVAVVANSAAYGEWEETTDITFTFTVSPAQRPIEGQINWITVNSTGGTVSSLIGEEAKTLYLYGGESDSTRTPYEKEQDDTLQDTVSVINSYVMYGRGGSIVALDSSIITGFTVTAYDGGEGTTKVTYEGKDIGVSATKAGIYIAEVTLEGSNNYILTYASSSANASSLGIAFEPKLTSSGYVYTLQKTWYIVMADGNSLLSGTTAFTLPKLSDGNYGWTYGDASVDSTLVAPTLSNTEVQVDGNYLISFEISSIDIWGLQNGSPAIQTFTYDKYTDYINYTMPAGYYDLTVKVAATGEYSDYERSFSFEVVKADYSDKLADWGVTGKIYGDLYKDRASTEVFTLEYAEGAVQFADTSSLKVLDLDPEDIYVRKGIWATSFYKDFYKEFTVEYNLDGLSNYYTEKDIEGGPVARGKYTVYFNITSSNYTSLVDTSIESDRKTYCYTLYIKETIDVEAIDLGSITYTGSEIRLPDTDYYKFVYLNGSDADSKRAAAAYGSNDEYVTAGTHYVAVMIRNGFTDSYGWKEGNTIKVYSEALTGGTTVNYYFAIREVVIGAAQNETTKPLSLGDWTFGDKPNTPVWSTKFVRADEDDFYSHVTFRLQSVKNLTENYYYEATEAGQKTFADAPAGEYRLIATAVGGEGYNWATLTETYEYNVKINKATIGLASEPYIESWKYGDYKAESVAPEFAFEEAFSALKTTYDITTRDEYEKYHKGEITEEEMKTRVVDVEYMLDSNKQVPAGNYVFVLKLDDGEEISDNYEAWSYAVYFSVVKTTNYWITTPSVHDWVYGDYSTRNNELEYAPKYGNKNSVIFNYYRVDENNIRTSQPYTDISGLIPQNSTELPVGKYEMCATLAGTNNYEELKLEHAYFYVTKAENGWKTDGVPGVKSWSQGNWNATDNKLTASPIFGDLVEFSVYAASDTNREKPYDIKNLNELGVGSYVLVAYVAGGANYEEMTSETTFAVFEDSVGMTGLIAVTMVFAVLAVGLAVGGIIMLIRRNKKIEDEFRRMIKVELRRK